MNPDIDMQTLHAYVDGELGLARALEIESRLDADPGLRAQVEALRQLRRQVREHADYHLAPAALRERLVASLGTPVAAAARPRPRRGRLGVLQPAGWPAGWSSTVATAVMTAALVAGLAAAGGAAWWTSIEGERLRQEVAAGHVRATLGEHLVDVASSDRHTVKPWLSSKLGYSPPVPVLSLPGSVFLGGRVDYLDGRPVAALVYRQGLHLVNAYVWPTTDGDSAPAYALERGYRLAHWAQQGMQHWVISDVNAEEFAALVQALRASGRDGGNSGGGSNPAGG